MRRAEPAALPGRPSFPFTAHPAAEELDISAAFHSPFATFIR